MPDWNGCILRSTPLKWLFSKKFLFSFRFSFILSQNQSNGKWKASFFFYISKCAPPTIESSALGHLSLFICHTTPLPYHASIIISYDKIYYFYTIIRKIFHFLFSLPPLFTQTSTVCMKYHLVVFYTHFVFVLPFIHTLHIFTH